MTLLAGYEQIQREFGLYLGYGRDPDNDWDTDDDDDFAACLRDGISEFLTAEGYKWRFLQPIRSLVLWPTTTAALSGVPTYSDPSSTLTAAAAAFYPTMIGKSVVFATSGNSYVINAYTSATVIKVTGDASGEASGDSVTITADGDYQLTSSFGGMSDPLWFTDTNNITYGPVDLSSANMVLGARSRMTSTARPCQAALAPLELDQSVGPQWMLMVQPTPNQVYTLKYKARLTPEAMTSELPYLVHPPYTRALSEAVLAAAESTFRDGETLHKLLFQRALTAAIRHDKAFYSARRLGLNLDPLAQQWGQLGGRSQRREHVRVNGIVPGID